MSVRLSTHLFLTNRTPWYFESQFADNPDVHDSGTTREFQGKRRWVRIFVFELQEPLFPFFLPFLLFVPYLTNLRPSRENKALRYKYLALCIISIELSGLSIRPKLPRNPNRRRLHGHRPCTFRVQRPPGFCKLRRPRDVTIVSTSSILSDHFFTISYMNR